MHRQLNSTRKSHRMDFVRANLHTKTTKEMAGILGINIITVSGYKREMGYHTYKHKHSRALIASVIEDAVSGLTGMQIADKYDIAYCTVNQYISLYFGKPKGPGSKIITLKSKV